MIANALVIAAAVYAVDFGWQPTDDGELEYIIQIEPVLLEAMRAGEPITSEIPPDLRGVRRFRIVVGDGELPRVDLPDVDEIPAIDEEHTDAAREPLRLEPETDGTSVLQATVQVQEAPSESSTDEAPNKAGLAEPSAPATMSPAKPWVPLILTLLGLFASIGGNVYLLWITWDTRKRYRTLVRDVAAS